ncbi:MAG: ferritin-like domain-containing protein [Smithella sp.]|nr:ferritin-like domain-containing protein [Smithella sp.]
MIIARENLIELLNIDLELESTATLQYINHATRLNGVVYRNTVTVLKGYAHRKLKNAMILSDQINYLGGFPSMRVSKVYTSDDNDEMLLHDLDLEEDTIQRLKIRIEQAELLKEVELAKWLRILLRDAQQHARYLHKQVGSVSCTDDDPHQGSDARDFSRAWAERAANVPVRIKKFC